jgi:hypothetical protein
MILRKVKNLSVSDYIQIGLYTYAVTSIVDHPLRQKLRLFLAPYEPPYGPPFSECPPMPKGCYIELKRNDFVAIGIIHQLPTSPDLIPEDQPKLILG